MADVEKRGQAGATEVVMSVSGSTSPAHSHHFAGIPEYEVALSEGFRLLLLCGSLDASFDDYRDSVEAVFRALAAEQSGRAGRV